MVLQIVMLCLVLVITFLNSMYGLFSGLINMVCTIVAMVVALGFFEPAVSLATNMVGWPPPSLMAPIVLVMLFVVSLLALRMLADKLIRGNLTVPMYVDWIGGGLCGFVIAQISVGILALGFLMLPFGETVATYSRYARTEEGGAVRFERSDFWTNPDGFTSGLFDFLSGGSLSGGTRFATIYPDFPKWVSWTSNTVQEESGTLPLRGKDGDGFEKGLRVVTWWDGVKEVPGRYRQAIPTREAPEPPYARQTYKPEPGNRLLGVRLELDPSSRDSSESGGTHRLRPTMLRVVGSRPGGSPDTATYEDYPVRLMRGADPKIQDAFRIADMDNNFAFGEGGAGQLDVYFEVPDDFLASFVEYRRFARAPFASAAKAEAAPSGALGSAAPAVAATGGTQPQNTGSGILRFADVSNSSRSGGYRDLPFQLDRAKLQRAPEVQLEDGKIASGRLSGPLQTWGPQPEQPTVRELVIPEGKAICQLTIHARKAGSLAGGVFNFVGATLNQYKALDSSGNEYPLKGYVAVTKRGGQDHFEMFYVGNNEDLASSFRGMLDLQYITKNELRDSDATEVALIFLVTPGVTIVRLENQTGQGVEGFKYEMPK